MRYAIITLCAALLGFAAFMAIGALRPSATSSLLNSVPSAAELKAMEAQATEACRCARRLKDKDPGREACWSAFEASIKRYDHSESAAACLPLSPSRVCFGESADSCVMREYGGGACTAAEARTLEAVWANAIDFDDEKSYDIAGKRMEEAVQAFIRGEKVKTSPPSGPTCSG